MPQLPNNPGKRSHDHIACAQFIAESGHPALGSLSSSRPRSSTARWHHHLPAAQGMLRPPRRSWDPAPLHHLSTFNPGASSTGENLKVQICTGPLLILGGSLLIGLPLCLLLVQLCLPPGTSSPPTFQKVVAFLLVDLQFCSLRPID